MKRIAILGLSVALPACAASLSAQTPSTTEGTTEGLTATDEALRQVRTARETAHGAAFGAVSRGRFDAPIEEVWLLFTDPERMRQWSPAPFTGELRLGGEFSIENNASGQVLRYEPPAMYRVSWIYQDNYSELEVRLGAIDGGATVVEIEHLMTAEDCARAGMSLSECLVAAGAGWDLALDYLDSYLRGERQAPPGAQDDGQPAVEGVEQRYSQYQEAWQGVAEEALDEQIGQLDLDLDLDLDDPAQGSPAAELAWLEQLAGEWETEGQAFLGPGQPPVQSKGTERVRRLGQSWVVSEIESSFMDMPFAAVFTLGYDAARRKFVGTWVDSASGRLWHYEGTLDADGKRLTLEKEASPCLGTSESAATQRDLIEIESVGERTLTSQTLIDGEWVTALTVRSRKQ